MYLEALCMGYQQPLGSLQWAFDSGHQIGPAGEGGREGGRERERGKGIPND